MNGSGSPRSRHHWSYARARTVPNSGPDLGTGYEVAASTARGATLAVEAVLRVVQRELDHLVEWQRTVAPDVSGDRLARPHGSELTAEAEEGDVLGDPRDEIREHAERDRDDARDRHGRGERQRHRG